VSWTKKTAETIKTFWDAESRGSMEHVLHGVLYRYPDGKGHFLGCLTDWKA